MSIQWIEKTVAIDDLRPYERNPRRATKEAYGKLLEAIKTVGYHSRIKTTHDLLIAGGHLRLRAMKELGFTEIKILVPDRPLTDAEFRQVLVQDNIEMGTFDMDILSADFDFEELKEWGMSDNLLGLFPKEPFDNEKADETPTLQAKVISNIGDLWICGRHRLLCGDSTKSEDIGRLLNGEKLDMVFCDPPYGVSIGSKNEFLSEFRKGGIEKNIENDTLKPEELYKILLQVFKNVVMFSNDCCAIYVCSPQGCGLGMMMMMMMMMMMKDAGLEVKHVLNWVKNHATFSLGRLDYDYQHEPILFTWVKTHKKIMGGSHKTSCWFIDKPNESKLHPTMKPVAIPQNAILNSSEETDLIGDFFGGAGSTLIACEQTNRRNVTMEIDPHYADVICRRFASFTGIDPVLESTGETFSAREKSTS